jgi:hypothetical protein
LTRRIVLLGVAFVALAAAGRRGVADDDAPEAAPPPLSALERFLRRPDWLSRTLAAKELGRRSEDGVIAAVGKALVSEQDERVTAALLLALRGRAAVDLVAEAPPEAIDRLIPLARDGGPVVARAALEVLARLSPNAPPGDELASYVSWWVRARKTWRAEAAAAQARRVVRPSAPLAPGETVTVPTGDDRSRYAVLERVHREGLEVMICLDSTASMGSVIEQAKASVASLVRRLRDLAPRFRVGLVTYDDAARLQVALTTDEGALEARLARVVAEGGGDAEEGVDRAVALALRQDASGWSSRALRAIVVVGDAPPHEDDLPALATAIRRARADPLYDAAVRVDTISCGSDGEPDGLVPHFRSIARLGGGSAVRLSASRSLAWEIVAAAFGPEWREAVLDLLADLDELDRASAKPSEPRKRR